MHEDKKALVAQQIAQLADAVKGRDITNIYFVACGGSLATLYPGKYILERESTKVSTGSYNANEFFHDPPARLGPGSLVVLNSQSGGTKETVSAARLARERGALTAAFTTTPGSALEEAVDHVIYYYDDPVNPYPMVLSIYPEVYMMVYAILDVLEGSDKSGDITDAMHKLEELCKKNARDHQAAAREFAVARRSEPLIYTIAAGLDCSISYVMTNCALMECLWIDSSPLHAGEFFHGAFEAVDKKTPVIAYLGLGRTRPVEVRAVEFLQRFSDKLTTLDAEGFDYGDVAEWTIPWIAPLLLNYVGSTYVNQLSSHKGQPMSSRRYMGVEKY